MCNTRFIVIFLFAVAASSSEAIEQQDSNTEFSAAEADFTESPISTQLDTMKTSSHHSIIRAALGRHNRSCITRFHILHTTTAKGESMDGKTTHKTTTAAAEYTVRVTPISKTKYGTQYKLEGRRLGGGVTRVGSATYHQKFRKCSITVDQAADGSIPTKSFTSRKGGACLPWMKNLLLKAVETLSPVKKHKAGLSEFTTVEDDALFNPQHKKRMAYSIKKLPNGDTAVSSQGTTLLELPRTVTGAKGTHKKQLNAMIKTHAHQLHVVSRHGELKKQKVHAKMHIGDVNKKVPPVPVTHNVRMPPLPPNSEIASFTNLKMPPLPKSPINAIAQRIVEGAEVSQRVSPSPPQPYENNEISAEDDFLRTLTEGVKSHS